MSMQKEMMETGVAHGNACSVKIENLGLSFGATKVLKGVNLEIKKGEFFAFLGPSGSGKSTLLRSIAGFGPRPEGRILIADEDVAGLPPWKRDVGMVFQSYALWPHMTVAQNVAFGLEERRLPKGEIKERVAEALSLVGLQQLASRRPSQLSGGQQQRVALARTIVIRPRVLLLDEPLSNLDANLRVQMRREILRLQRRLQLTTIFVTHDQEEANTTSDRMAVLDDGVIQQVGTPMDLYDKPVNAFVAGFLGTANILAGHIESDDRGGGPTFVSDGGFRLAVVSTATGAARIVLRPQMIALGPCTSDTALQGKIMEREFLGSSIRYNVSVGQETLVVDQAHVQDVMMFAPGQEAAISINSKNVTILAA